MTPEQQAAFIMAQVAVTMARVAGMQAENQHRLAVGRTDLYTEAAFDEAANHYTLGHNAVISFFQS